MTYPEIPNRKAHAQSSSASVGTGQPQSDFPPNHSKGKGYGYSSGGVREALANAFPRRPGATPAATTPPPAMPTATTPVAAVPAATTPPAPSVGTSDHVEFNSEDTADPFQRTSFKFAPDEYAEIVNHRPTPEPLERIFDTTTIGRIFRFRQAERDGAETGTFWRNWMWLPVALLIGSAFIGGGYLASKTRMHSTTQSAMPADAIQELPSDNATRVEPQIPEAVTEPTLPNHERQGAITVTPVPPSVVEARRDVTEPATSVIGTGRDNKVPASSGDLTNREAKVPASSGDLTNVKPQASSGNVQTKLDAKATGSTPAMAIRDAKTAVSDTRSSDASTKSPTAPTMTPKVTMAREGANASKAPQASKASREATPKSVPPKKVNDEAPKTPFVRTPFIPAD